MKHKNIILITSAILYLAGVNAHATTSFGVTPLHIQAAQPSSDSDYKSLQRISVRPYFLTSLDDQWEELKISFYADYTQENKEPGDSFSDATAYPEEIYLRYGDAMSAITVGYQLIEWGQLTGQSIMNPLLGRESYRHFLIDDFSDRRVGTPVVRWDQHFGEIRVDSVWYPWFQANILPEESSLWYPIDRPNGRVVGLPQTDELRDILSQVAIRDNHDTSGSGGIGARISHQLDWGEHAVTLKRFRHHQPHFELEPLAVQAYGMGATYDDFVQFMGRAPEFRSRHISSNLIGYDLSFMHGSSITRLELAYLSSAPFTTPTFELTEESQIAWGIGHEITFQTTDSRINIEVTGEHASPDEDVLEETDRSYLSGRYTQHFAQQRWAFDLNFSTSLTESSSYINPTFTYRGIDNHEIYAAYHHFSGDDTTLFGFYSDGDLFTIGYRYYFDR